MNKKPNNSRAPDSAAKRLRLYIEAMVANGGNKRDAGLKAGCKNEKAADQYAARMSQNIKVTEEIDRRANEVLRKAQEATGLTINGTLRELARIVHIDPAKFFDKEGNLLGIHEMPEAARAAIASIEIEERFEGSGDQRQHKGFMKKFKLWDKNSAIEKAMKHLGQFEKDNAQKPPLLPPEIRIVGVRSK